MFAIQRESGLAVIEILSAPAFKTMTPTTIRDAGLLKLHAMHILMTGHAILARSGKAALGKLCISGMASLTVGTLVGAFQLEFCTGVIKLAQLFPFESGMAYAAVLIGVI